MERAERWPLATASTRTRGPNATSPPGEDTGSRGLEIVINLQNSARRDLNPVFIVDV